MDSGSGLVSQGELYYKSIYGINLLLVTLEHRGRTAAVWKDPGVCSVTLGQLEQF